MAAGPVVPAGRGVREAVEAVLAAFCGIGIAVVTLLTQAGAWAVEQYRLAVGDPLTGWFGPLVSAGSALLVAVPSVALALLARGRAVRAAGRVWTLAAVVLLVLSPVRAVPVEQNEATLGLLAVAAGALAWGLHIFGRRVAHYRPSYRAERARRPRARAETLRALAFGLATGLVMLLPWVWVGALGAPVETALGLAAAVAVGWLATAVCAHRWLEAPYAQLADAGIGRLVVGGLVAGVALVVVAAGVGGSGVQLPLMLALPAAAFAGAALTRIAPRRRVAVGALFALTAAGPLVFVEPFETTVLLGLHDVGYWTAIGGLCCLGVALLLGGGLMVPRRLSLRVAGPAALAVALIAGGTVYAVAGHPGFHGDRLFVVMREQADLSGLATIADPKARRAAVYAKLVRTADTSQAALRRQLRAWHLAYQPFYLVNGLEVDADPAVRGLIAARGDVDRVLLAPTLRPVPSLGPPILVGRRPAPTSPEWNLTMIRADRVWGIGDTGRGVVIGNSDSGVDGSHPALAASFRGGGDSWYDPWDGSPTPVDHLGHGTHVMGSALGANGIGVAPGAQWMACVNLERNLGNPARYLDCLQFMLAPFPRGGDAFHGDPARGADVLTNSWSCPSFEGCDLGALRSAVDALTTAGLFVVAAAGNAGPRCSSIDDPPAPYANTFTVGAVDALHDVAGFSSRGPAAGGTAAKPDVVAPGVDVVSALPGGGYGALSGTSMATPQVAGVVALMWSASPALRGDVARTAQILRSTATPATGDGRCPAGDEIGAGLVDAYGAVTAAIAAGQP